VCGGGEGGEGDAYVGGLVEKEQGRAKGKKGKKGEKNG